MVAAAGCATSILVLVVSAVIGLRATFVAHRQTTINMEPTIARGDRVVSRRAGTISRGDVVVFVMPADGGLAVKRVIALPGENVEVRGGMAVINGAPLDEPYVSLQEGAEPQMPVLRDAPAVQVPPDTYFLMGDNRDHSNDSRFIGPIGRGHIRRQAVLIISKSGGIRRP